MSNEIEPSQTMPFEPRHPIPPAPIHPLAALATITLDNLFGVVEILDPLALILTSVSVGVTGMVTTMLVQHYLAKDGWGASAAKGMVMGILAGVPFQVVGTVVGIPLLAWAGLHEWIKTPVGKQQEQLRSDGDVIDIVAKPKE
jgi:hypothetical protein